jgi:hypothetical protein
MEKYIPNDYKLYQMALKMPNGYKINKCRILVNSKDFKNRPILGLLVCKYTIWQPCNPHILRGREIFQMALKYIDILQFKSLQNTLKLVFLVCK